MNRLYKTHGARSSLSQSLSSQSKVAVLEALIAQRRLELGSTDVKAANRAKAALIGLYRAKKYLESMSQAMAA